MQVANCGATLKAPQHNLKVPKMFKNVPYAPCTRSAPYVTPLLRNQRVGYYYNALGRAKTRCASKYRYRKPLWYTTMHLSVTARAIKHRWYKLAHGIWCPTHLQLMRSVKGTIPLWRTTQGWLVCTTVATHYAHWHALRRYWYTLYNQYLTNLTNPYQTLYYSYYTPKFKGTQNV